MMATKGDKRSFVVGELKRLPSSRGLKESPDKFWIRCPWHKNGNENTPSLAINVSGSGKFGPGAWHCFGCGKEQELPGGGTWDNLAPILKLRCWGGKQETPDADVTALPDNVLPQDDERALKLRKERKRLRSEPKYDPKYQWRGIPGWLMAELGTIDTEYNGFPKFYIPITVNKKLLSGVYCSPRKSELSYLYDGDKSISKAIFPYDLVKKLLKKIPKKHRYVVYVEGPRDALHLIANGIVAVANLGGNTSWNKNKLERLLELKVNYVILAGDPDEVGDKLNRVVRKDIKEHLIKSIRFKMDSEEIIKGEKSKNEDPGSLTRSRIKDLKCLIQKVTGLTNL